MTVTELITSSLRLINVGQPGETPNTDELTDGLATLNQLIDNWRALHPLVFVMRTETFPLTAGNGTYTIGTGGDFDSDRPVKIESAGVIQSNGLRTDLALVTSKMFASIPEKSAQAMQPLVLYIDNDYPLAKIQLNPIPKLGTTTLELVMWTDLAFFALTDVVDMPPAYLKAIRYNLAVDLAPEYEREPSPLVITEAQKALAAISGLNIANFAAQEDPPPPPPAPPPQAA
jgi:hypothetical protein